MIKLQDIADMAGVSRTTVSNVLHGNTKRVSKETVDKIRRILEEQKYEPNIGSLMLNGQGSKVIGFVLGYTRIHDRPAIMDSFIGELLSAIQKEAEEKGYYIMIIGGDQDEQVLNMASRWNIEGLIIMGYSAKRYQNLKRKLNKHAVLIDTYPYDDWQEFYNVGIDDFEGSYRITEYLLQKGFRKLIFMAEITKIDIPVSRDMLSNKNQVGPCNYRRYQGFAAALAAYGLDCENEQFVILSKDRRHRVQQYEQMLNQGLKFEALVVASDYNAMEVMNVMQDHGIRVPEDISVVGFDDCIYAEFCRPRLTTMHQDVYQKGAAALDLLISLIQGRKIENSCLRLPVSLVIRDSVR